MTPHINAGINDFAKTVLMPGDPLRAKFIAENFLEDAKLVTDVRNMLGYTGYYKGRRISVMGSGMGMPSMGIYSYELINVYKVENLIRIGSCGAYDENLNLFDIVLAEGACTNSSYIDSFEINGTYSAIASFDLLNKAYEKSKELNLNTKVGNVLSSDVFYQENKDGWKKWQDLNVLAVEMETYAMYLNAAKYNAKALSILTVSDSLVKQEETTAKEREQSFTNMMTLALEITGE